MAELSENVDMTNACGGIQSSAKMPVCTLNRTESPAVSKLAGRSVHYSAVEPCCDG